MKIPKNLTKVNKVKISIEELIDFEDKIKSADFIQMKHISL